MRPTVACIALAPVGNADTRTVRAYRTNGEAFAPGSTPETLSLAGQDGKVTEDALVGPGGKTHHRLAGHIAYRFAGSGYPGDVGYGAR